MMWHAELANPLISGTKVLAQDQEQSGCSQIQKCWCKVCHKFGQGQMIYMRSKNSGPIQDRKVADGQMLVGPGPQSGRLLLALGKKLVKVGSGDCD
jgi:hypothetical protein